MRSTRRNMEDNEQPIRKPNIISFDLEVSPALGYFYPPTWETGILKTMERQKLMSFAWQLVGTKKIHTWCLNDFVDYSRDPRDDRALTEELHTILSDADILLGQNSDNFDVKMANYFFIMNDLEPIPPTKYLDTKKIAKRYFRFLNNTLDNLGEELGVGGKTKVTVKDLWEDAFLHQDPEAWRLMNEYCANDVRVTTEIYLKMRGFMHSHPSVSRISGDFDSCPRCGSFSFRIKAYRTSNTTRYHQFQCNDCHGYFSDRKGMTEDEDIKPMYVNI